MRHNKLWKKAMALTCAAACAATTLAGCGSSTQAEKPSEKTEAQGESGAAEGQTEITFTVWDYETTDYWKKLVEAFEAENPDIKVKVMDIGATDYDTKIPVLLSSGDTSDVITIKSMNIYNSLVEKNQLMPLDDKVKESGVDMAPYQGSDEGIRIDDKLYGLPFRNDYYLLYYNKTLFDQAGVEYPKNDMTWDEYEELAKQMTSGEGSSKVYGTHNHTWQALVSNWAVQDGKNTLMSEDYSFMKPAYEQAVRMQDEGIMQSYANLKTGSIHYISVFEQQQCAMLPMGSWFIGTLIQDKEAGKFGFNWGVTTIPHPEGVEAGATVGSTTPVAINAKSDDPDLAWEFVKFATGEEGAMALADNGIFPAASTDAINEKLAAIPGFPEDGTDALNITSWVLDRPIDAKMAAVRKVLEEEHDLIMIGEEDIDTGIANMNQRAKEARED